jgi:hypothetical protein
MRKLWGWLCRSHFIMGQHWELLYDPHEWGITIRALVPVYFRAGLGPFHFMIW